jgi:hypothetical protein
MPTAANNSKALRTAAAAAGVTTLGLRPPFVTPAAAYSHPDCRATGVAMFGINPDRRSQGCWSSRFHLVIQVVLFRCTLGQVIFRSSP